MLGSSEASDGCHVAWHVLVMVSSTLDKICLSIFAINVLVN